MTLPDDLSALNKKPFSDAVSKLEELIAQGGRSFLLGAGCSKCAGLPLTTELTEKVLSVDTLNGETKQILTTIKELFEGASDANIEDYLSELIDLLAITDRRDTRGATQKSILLGGESYRADTLRTAADEIKRCIARVIDSKVSIETHQRFIKAVHRPQRPGKPMSGQSVDYLVLNYDTIIEDALALERIPFSDGFDGGVTGWWNPDTFDRDGLVARVYKLHGSINWCEIFDDPLPRRIADCLKAETCNERRILIWPASTKYRETQLDPYAQLSERVRQVLRPIRGFQRLLIICGYRFGDAHINFEIDHALRGSAGDLTIVAFTSDKEPSGQLKKWHTDASVSEQLLIFANHGFFHGDQVHLSDDNLLWWKFENIVRIIGGER